MGFINNVCEMLSPFSIAKRKDLLSVVNEIAVDVATMREANQARVRKVLMYKKQLQDLEKKRAEEQRLFISVLDHLEDMVWAKDKDGRYIMANKAFRNKFCYGMEWNELKGKTDLEIASVFKQMVGDANHTFGEVCMNSDEIIVKTNQAREFLEYGNIDGKLVKLIVNKSPVYDGDGVLFATCGSGRDVTKLHDKLEEALSYCASWKGTEAYDKLENLFKEIEFKEEHYARNRE